MSSHSRASPERSGFICKLVLPSSAELSAKSRNCCSISRSQSFVLRARTKLRHPKVSVKMKDHNLHATLLLLLAAAAKFCLTAASSTAVDTKLLNETLALLEDGNRIIKLEGEHKDLTLLVGLSGSGKSTMTQIVSGDWRKLEAYEKNYDILIRDTGPDTKISNGTDTLRSKTLFPELVVDKETGEAMYDCPGFKDTRSTSIEIANGFFMKKLVEHARTVKILVVAKYDALKVGGSREWFRNLVTQLLKFMRNVPKYQGGIALIATKVDVVPSEQRVLQKIAAFLEESHPVILESLPERKQDIDALFGSWLEKDSKGLPINIQFFHQPTEVGLLSEMPDANTRRARVRQMLFLNDRFKHQPCNSSDFGIPLSGNAEAQIQKIQIDLSEKVDQDISTISSALRQHIERAEATSILSPPYFQAIIKAAEQFTNGEVISAQQVLGVVEDLAIAMGVPGVTKAAMRMNDTFQSLEYLDYLKSNQETVTTSKYANKLQTIINEVAHTAELNVRSKIGAVVDTSFAKSKDNIEQLIKSKNKDQQFEAIDYVANVIDDITLNSLDFQKSVKKLEDLNSNLGFGLDTGKLETAAMLEKLLPAGGMWAEQQRSSGFLAKLHENLEKIAVSVSKEAGITKKFPGFGQNCTKQ